MGDDTPDAADGLVKTHHPDLNRILSNIATNLQRSTAGMLSFFGRPEVLDVFQSIAANLKTLPSRVREQWSTAVENGWYPNGETSAQIAEIVDSGPKALDTFMVEHLEESWDNLTVSILLAHQNRAEILKTAFILHEDRNYIASIPLFISQAEGIINDTFKFSIFHDKNLKEETLSRHRSDANWFDEILFELVGINTQLHAGSSSKSLKKKSKAPSRNGILHGSKHHLDYGTKINSLKVFSLLAFASFLSQSKSKVHLSKS